MNKEELAILNEIAKRAHLLINQMIYVANNRSNQEKGDPKVGGHPSASTSALHIIGALHLVTKSGYDQIVNKPHASPTDHAYLYLLNLLLDQKYQALSHAQAEQAMRNLRAFPANDDEFVFQSYHSSYDPDHHNFLPSGTVGIPPVMQGYLALAYRAATIQGYTTPPAHFWAVMGDSEFREGSLMEAVPDFAEREIGNLTWILDFNRQSLDGHRFSNPNSLGYSDALRIEKTMQANGWEVIQVQHGSLREKIFSKKGGEDFKTFLEKDIKDHEFHSCLFQDGKNLRRFLSTNRKLNTFLQSVNDDELKEAFHDLGGHDFVQLTKALEKSKKNDKKPTCIIVHTLKGWGLQMAGLGGNHSYLVSKEEMEKLRNTVGDSSEFPLFSENSKAGRFLKKRREKLYKEMLSQKKIKEKNESQFKKNYDIPFPPSLSLEFERMSYPHTQWFLGQITAKLARISNADNTSLKKDEQKLKAPARLVYTLSPDVGTSTNLAPTMNEKVFGPSLTSEENILRGLDDRKSPDLFSQENAKGRFLRFEIVEANSISCMASFGKMRDILGIPLLPIMTIYDFFIKRALDQFFYSLYWNSSFILIGTPSGVTLSPEGAQHGWKSDFQIPNQIIWEPFFLHEMDWIVSDAMKRHFEQNNKGRTGVLIRAVTRGVDQKQFIECLKSQKRFKKNQNILLSPKNHSLPSSQNEPKEENISHAEMFTRIRQEVLAGAYYLLDYRGYADYVEQENVIHLFSMGSPSTSALSASKELLKQGIYANLIVVTSPDLLLGNLADENHYSHLKQNLSLDQIQAPVVSVHDGEPGLLDNIGSILGVQQKSLAVRKHSLCGRPSDIYKYHKLDKDSIIQASWELLNTHSQKYFQRSLV